MSKTVIMTPERVRRTIQRLAYEVVEQNRGSVDLHVFGIPTKGLVLAKMVAEELSSITSSGIVPNELDITPFRDDITDGTSTLSNQGEDLQDKDVLLIDDVLFTGRTARAALDAIRHRGRPRSVQLAVLIDRGHREYPIQPDYVGRVIPTKYDERIEFVAEGEPSVFLVE